MTAGSLSLFDKFLQGIDTRVIPTGQSVPKQQPEALLEGREKEWEPRESSTPKPEPPKPQKKFYVSFDNFWNI